MPHISDLNITSLYGMDPISLLDSFRRFLEAVRGHLGIGDAGILYCSPWALVAVRQWPGADSILCGGNRRFPPRPFPIRRPAHPHSICSGCLLAASMEHLRGDSIPLGKPDTYPPLVQENATERQILKFPCSPVRSVYFCLQQEVHYMGTVLQSVGPVARGIIVERLHELVLHDPRHAQLGLGGLLRMVFQEVAARAPHAQDIRDITREFWQHWHELHDRKQRRFVIRKETNRRVEEEFSPSQQNAIGAWEDAES